MHPSGQRRSCSSATSAIASRKEKSPHRKAALLRNNSTASSSRRRRKTASTWKRPSSTSSDNCASNEQTRHRPATPRATTREPTKANDQQRTRTTTTTGRRRTATAGHGRTEASVVADPSVLSSDSGPLPHMYMKTKTKRETAAHGGSAVVSRPFASRCNSQLELSPQSSSGTNNFEPSQPTLHSTSCRAGMTAKQPVVLVFESVRRCISAYAECMTPNDNAGAPQHTVQPATCNWRSTCPRPPSQICILGLPEDSFHPIGLSGGFLCDLA